MTSAAPAAATREAYPFGLLDLVEQGVDVVAIDADLSVSAAVLPELPASSRRAVALAQSLFAELSVRLRRTPADQLVRSRVRVPNPVKLRLAIAAGMGRTP